MWRTALVAVGIVFMLGAMTVDGMAGVYIPMPWLCEPFPKLCERPSTAAPPPAEQSAGTPKPKEEPAPQPRNKRSAGTTGAKKNAPAQQGPQSSARLQRDFEDFLAERARRAGRSRSAQQSEDKDELFREFVQWQKDRPSSRSR